MTTLDREFVDYLEEGLWDEIVRDSEQRLADPLPFALEALEDLFRHESNLEGGFRRFRMKLESFLWWADDAVQCLEKVLENPPPDLGRLVRDQAGVLIRIKEPAGLRIGDDAAHAAWLRVTTERLRAQFDAYVAEKTAEMKAAKDAE